MAIGTADRDLLVTLLMETFGDDYNGIARVLARLEVRFPSVAWRSRLQTLALSFPQYQNGLSITWFTNEVGRLADSYKG